MMKFLEILSYFKKTLGFHIKTFPADLYQILPRVQIFLFFIKFIEFEYFLNTSFFIDFNQSQMFLKIR